MEDDKVSRATVAFGRREGVRLFSEIMAEYPQLDENDFRASTIALELFENAVIHLRGIQGCSERYLIKKLIHNIELADKWVQEHDDKNA